MKVGRIDQNIFRFDIAMSNPILRETENHVKLSLELPTKARKSYQLRKDMHGMDGRHRSVTGEVLRKGRVRKEGLNYKGDIISYDVANQWNEIVMARQLDMRFHF